MANFEVIQSSKVSNEIYCFHYCSIKQRTICIINVWGYTEILPIFGLYREVPLDRVWFFCIAVLNREYNFTHLCSKQAQNLSLTGYGITSQEMLHIDRIDHSSRSSFFVFLCPTG